MESLLVMVFLHGCQFKIRVYIKIPIMHSLKPVSHISLPSPTISLSSNSDHICVCTMDQSTYIWTNKWPLATTPKLSLHEQISTVVDICFTSTSNCMAMLGIDSGLKIWDVDTWTVQTVDLGMFSAWRASFVGEVVYVAGDLGRIWAVDGVSREVVKKMEVGDYFITAINKYEDQSRLVVGNTNGDIYIVPPDCKQPPRSTPLHPHSSPILSLQIPPTSPTTLYSCSSDRTICRMDLQKPSHRQYYSGHSCKVTGIRNHSSNPHLLYSCSADRSLRVWDDRVKGGEVAGWVGAGELAGMVGVADGVAVGGDVGGLWVFSG